MPSANNVLSLWLVCNATIVMGMVTILDSVPLMAQCAVVVVKLDISPVSSFVGLTLNVSGRLGFRVKNGVHARMKS